MKKGLQIARDQAKVKELTAKISNTPAMKKNFVHIETDAGNSANYLCYLEMKEQTVVKGINDKFTLCT